MNKLKKYYQKILKDTEYDKFNRDRLIMRGGYKFPNASDEELEEALDWAGSKVYYNKGFLASQLIRIAKKLVRDSDIELFDSLRKGQKIKLAFSSVMGTGSLTDGGYHEWIVGRKSHSKKYGVTTLRVIPVGFEDRKWTKYNSYTLRKRENSRTGETFIGAAHGDMGITLKGMKK